MILKSNYSKINSREDVINILNFQTTKNLLIPPSYLYILFNFGEIKYNGKNKLYYSDENYNEILIDTIPSIHTLSMWLENYWAKLLMENENLSNNYLPILSTYASNIMFLVGVHESNLDRIFLYDDDYENFCPVLLADNIFQFFTGYVKIE